MRVIRKYHSEDFKTDAIALVERGDRSFARLGLDLGVSEWTLRHWYNQWLMAKRSPKKKRAAAAPSEETPEQKVDRLERELTRLHRRTIHAAAVHPEPPEPRGPGAGVCRDREGRGDGNGRLKRSWGARDSNPEPSD